MSVAGRIGQILSVAGLVLFLMVRVEKTADANGESTVTTAGLWFSPWYVREDWNQPGKGAGFRMHMELLSWSWLCLIPAAVVGHRVVRPGDRPQPEPAGHDHQ